MAKNSWNRRLLVAGIGLATTILFVSGDSATGRALAQFRRIPRPSGGRPIPSQSQGQQTGGKEDMSGHDLHTLSHQGTQRRYFVYVPKNLDRSEKHPVVMCFHGGMGKASGIKTQSKMDTLADKYGFLAVYPDGTGPGKMLTYNAGTCCAYAVQHKIDDVGFVRKVIDDLGSHYSVDPQRIYATGLSNGAMLCYRLACELSDKIAAIGPVSGDLGVNGPKPKRPVPIIHFHGMKDPNCPYEGGVGSNAFTKVSHRSVADTIGWWVKADNCQPEPVEIKKETDYIMKRWEPAPGNSGAPIVLYSLPDGGHNWPGGVDTSARAGTGNQVKTVDASTIMWKFFEKFTLDGQVATKDK